MHGLGNDFVLFESIDRPIALSRTQLQFIADRRRGIGCDQVLVIEPAHAHDADFRFRIYNADGSEVEQCGNGARCVARYLHERGLLERLQGRLETAGGLVGVELESDGRVTINMGTPCLKPEQIPFIAEGQAPTYRLDLECEEVDLAAVSMGNPHAVLRVDDVQTAPVARLGARIEKHPRFPNRVNVGFMQVIDRTAIRLRVFERGVGETLACGSGACAAVVAGRVQGWLDARVAVELPGGQLIISWRDANAPVLMTGEATKVFEGSIEA
jgi:diaminopimelate epimerase